MIGIFYRHNSRTDIPIFTNHMECVLRKFNCTDTSYFICGDFNVNSLIWEDYSIVSTYINTMFSHGAIQVINKSTHFPRVNQVGSPSLLDHFYTNVPNRIQKVGLLMNDISDHSSILTTLRTDCSHIKLDNTRFVRDLSHITSASFNSLLA